MARVATTESGGDDILIRGKLMVRILPIFISRVGMLQRPLPDSDDQEHQVLSVVVKTRSHCFIFSSQLASCNLPINIFFII